MDGNTNTQQDRAGLRMMPMSEVMIREVQVVTSGFAPEFGNTTGLVYNAVTPSGTNTFRGDVGYRFHRKSWSAFPFFFQGPRTEETRPDNSLNIFTATVGGPIVRNSVHFYTGYERTYREMPRLINIDPGIAAQVGVAPQPAAVDSAQSPAGSHDPILSEKMPSPCVAATSTPRSGAISRSTITTSGKPAPATVQAAAPRRRTSGPKSVAA